MKISKQTKGYARQLFRSCRVNGILDPDRVRRTVSLVLAQKPRGYFEILTRLTRLVKLDLDRRTTRVESARPLSPQLQTEVREHLVGLYGTGLTISFVENPALIGGLRIQVGSDLYDGSVNTKLNRLAASF